jgi:hypothetical protein
MKPRLLFWTVGLVAALMVASCAPAESAPPPAPQVESTPAAVDPAPTAVPEAIAPPQAEEPQVQAVATSRGPDLHATDPTTVSLAAGQLQLVEFFRFT